MSTRRSRSGKRVGRSADAAFCTVFDLTKRIPREELDKAQHAGLLHASSLDTGTLDAAWPAIERGVAKCKEIAAEGKRAPVLRILLRDFGSPDWGGGALVPFMLRLRTLARTLSMPTTGTPIPCIVNAALSSHLACAPRGANLLHRLMHLGDGCIGLTSFAASAGLRDVFPDSTGALRVFKTPAIGTLTNPSLRASVLRGMGAGTAQSAARSEGGAGGGENNLAFKVRRKRLVIDTLHLDIEGGVSERRTKPKEGVGLAQKGARPAETSAPPAPVVEVTTEPSTAPTPAPAAAPAPAPAPRLPHFGGLASLRERGLQARADAHPSKQDYEF